MYSTLMVAALLSDGCFSRSPDGAVYGMEVTLEGVRSRRRVGEKVWWTRVHTVRSDIGEEPRRLFEHNSVRNVCNAVMVRGVVCQIDLRESGGPVALLRTDDLGEGFCHGAIQALDSPVGLWMCWRGHRMGNPETSAELSELGTGKARTSVGVKGRGNTVSAVPTQKHGTGNFGSGRSDGMHFRVLGKCVLNDRDETETFFGCR